MFILAADDDPAIRRYLTRVFAVLGYRSEIVEDGPALLRRAAQERPDLVLSDIDLPGCDGIRACRELRVVMPGLRIVLMTGSLGLADEARESGFAVVLNKPFTLDELKGALASF